MTAQEKLLNLLGLAYKSGKTVCGDFACENYLKKHTVPIMFLASDGGGAPGSRTATTTRFSPRRRCPASPTC